MARSFAALQRNSAGKILVHPYRELTVRDPDPPPPRAPFSENFPDLHVSTHLPHAWGTRARSFAAQFGRKNFGAHPYRELTVRDPG